MVMLFHRVSELYRLHDFHALTCFQWFCIDYNGYSFATDIYKVKNWRCPRIYFIVSVASHRDWKTIHASLWPPKQMKNMGCNHGRSNNLILTVTSRGANKKWLQRDKCPKNCQYPAGARNWESGLFLNSPNSLLIFADLATSCRALGSEHIQQQGHKNQMWQQALVSSSFLFVLLYFSNGHLQSSPTSSGEDYNLLLLISCYHWAELYDWWILYKQKARGKLYRGASPQE